MAALRQGISASENAHVTSTSLKARIPQHVVYRTLASETVMLDLQTGRYYGLNQTAGRMLEMLERGVEVDAAAAQLAAEFEIPAETVRQDFLDLCNGLAAKGLVEFEPTTAADSA